ncbi:MAG TPA: HAMP domain-containing sensor histidine kinase [Trebonia sp.]
MHNGVHETTDIGHRLSLLCHELQQAITGILTQAAAALAEPGLALTSKQYLEQIVQQANWLAQMIGDFLQSVRHDMTRLGTVHNGPGCQGTALPDIVGSQTVQPDTVAGTAADDVVARDPDVTEVVDDTVTVARMTWSGQVTVTSPGEPVRCRLHPILLRRVISNVLSNAMRAAGPHGSVTIQTKRYQDMAMLSIWDTGPGFGMIPKGFGIGLAEVARVVAGSGGRMELGNTAEGGVRVSLWLPGETDAHSP